MSGNSLKSSFSVCFFVVFSFFFFRFVPFVFLSIFETWRKAYDTRYSRSPIQVLTEPDVA